MDRIASPVRKAAVAGQFYPGNHDELERTVRELIGPGPAQPALGALAPHAGYMYSGAVAGAVYGSVEMPKRFVILGPNHTGLGPAASVMSNGVWQMPGGDVRIDTELAGAIIAQSQLVSTDDSAHAFEHSIEVQLPFLQLLAGDISFVPIALMLTEDEHSRDIGQAVAAAVRSVGEPVLVIASSDMSHYEPQEVAQEKDHKAIDRLLALDPAGLLETVRREHISMCGAVPAACMLYACRELGASSARLVSYRTSGDVTGDYGRVVGYAGVVITA